MKAVGDRREHLDTFAELYAAFVKCAEYLGDQVWIRHVEVDNSWWDEGGSVDDEDLGGTRRSPPAV